jgi:hypothetical protein
MAPGTTAAAWDEAMAAFETASMPLQRPWPGLTALMAYLPMGSPGRLLPSEVLRELAGNSASRPGMAASIERLAAFVRRLLTAATDEAYTTPAALAAATAQALRREEAAVGDPYLRNNRGHLVYFVTMVWSVLLARAYGWDETERGTYATTLGEALDLHEEDAVPDDAMDIDEEEAQDVAPASDSAAHDEEEGPDLMDIGRLSKSV